jgi:hypothetical protein
LVPPAVQSPQGKLVLVHGSWKVPQLPAGTPGGRLEHVYGVQQLLATPHTCWPLQAHDMLPPQPSDDPFLVQSPLQVSGVHWQVPAMVPDEPTQVFCVLPPDVEQLQVRFDPSPTGNALDDTFEQGLPMPPLAP